MNGTILTTIAATGFGIAFLHTAIPTHWLPFVLTARAQRWSRPKTLGITAIAGSGHVLFTALLGLLVAIFGVALDRRIGAWFPRLAGGAVFVFGCFYLVRHWRGHTHGHHAGGHLPNESAALAGDHFSTHTAPQKSDAAAMASLFALLTLSPCESFLPVYISGVRYGWQGFVLLTAILSVATVAGMVSFTWLTLAGITRLKLAVFERWENAIIGAMLLLLGAFIVLFEK